MGLNNTHLFTPMSMSLSLLFLLLFVFPPSTKGRQSLVDIFWQMKDVDRPTNGNPYLGGQNFTTCCLKAINASVEVDEHDILQYIPGNEDWIRFPNNSTDANLLVNYSNAGQFPCTAVYDGNPIGAPVVWANYSWFVKECPGWQVSSKDNLNAWLQPLSGFIVPAVIFCLSVPRRRRLEVPRAFFAADQAGIKSYLTAPFGAIIALIMVSFDTIIWLCICFAFAGPMIISGLYEAMLDNCVIDYLKTKINERHLTLDMRCRCLMVILIGNLDLVWNTDLVGGSGGFVDSRDSSTGYVIVNGQEEDSHDNENNDTQHDGGWDGKGGREEQHMHGERNSRYFPESSRRSAEDAGLIQQPLPAPRSTSVPSTPPPRLSLAEIAPEAIAMENFRWNIRHKDETNIPDNSERHGETVRSTSLAPGLNIVPPPEPIRPEVSSNTQVNTVPSRLGSDAEIFSVDASDASPNQLPPPRESQSLVRGTSSSAGHTDISTAKTDVNERATHIVHVDGMPSNKQHMRAFPASPWQHMEQSLYHLRLYNDDISLRGHSPRQYARFNRSCEHGPQCQNGGNCEQPIPWLPTRENEIGQMKKRLQAMLLCQYSFGSVVGAPVVFFLGGFIFALLQSLSTLGVESIAIGIAFGQWYMTIPHITIVSGLLLAGNNPNILEGVLGLDQEFVHDDIKILGLTYGLAYPSCYKVAWLWDRGHNKRQWLNTLIDTYLKRKDVTSPGDDSDDEDMVDLREKTTLGLIDWSFLVALTMVLIGLPFVLAFTTAYFTPEVGLSCRSLTFTIYLLVQVCQMILWLWAYAGPLEMISKGKPGLFGRKGWLDRNGFYRPYSLRWLINKGPVPRNPLVILHMLFQNPQKLLCWQFLWNVIYYLAQWVLGLVGIMATIGGTAMQLIGVYSADICYITAPSWFKPLEDRPQVIISVNSAEMIYYSDRTWKPCAITAIVFMGVVSFVGWWYQRRMRDLFAEQVTRIDYKECLETQMAHLPRGQTRQRAPSAWNSAIFVPQGHNNGLPRQTPHNQVPSPRSHGF